jgi:UrcA family protein
VKPIGALAHFSSAGAAAARLALGRLEELKMSIRIIPALVAALSLGATGVALAQPGEPSEPDEVVVAPFYAPPGAEVRFETVSFADLDLGTRAGAYTLMGRINAAAKRVCSPDATAKKDLRDAADYDACMGQAVDRAVEEVSAPALTDLYRYGGGYRIARGYNSRGY